MRPLTRALLGSAASVFAASGVQAADIPANLAVKARPVEYVRACTLYGAGFWYVPGTDTCIKIGAFVKLQVGENLNQGGPFIRGAASNGGGDGSGRNNRVNTSDFTFNNRAAVSWDIGEQ